VAAVDSAFLAMFPFPYSMKHCIEQNGPSARFAQTLSGKSHGQKTRDGLLSAQVQLHKHQAIWWE
jgi:hypothetical protein